MKINAYSPAVMVIRSKINHKNIHIIKPFFAISADFTEATLWKKLGSIIVQIAIKNQTVIYCKLFPPRGSKWLSGKDEYNSNGETELYHAKHMSMKKPTNIKNIWR